MRSGCPQSAQRKALSLRGVTVAFREAKLLQLSPFFRAFWCFFSAFSRIPRSLDRAVFAFYGIV
jgi:hypothetical protein